jgi:hypothetical protein
MTESDDTFEPIAEFLQKKLNQLIHLNNKSSIKERKLDFDKAGRNKFSTYLYFREVMGGSAKESNLINYCDSIVWTKSFDDVHYYIGGNNDGRVNLEIKRRISTDGKTETYSIVSALLTIPIGDTFTWRRTKMKYTGSSKDASAKYEKIEAVFPPGASYGQVKNEISWTLKIILSKNDTILGAVEKFQKAKEGVNKLMDESSKMLRTFTPDGADHDEFRIVRVLK